ncbi:hypothetical protein DZS_05660 [Dickeya ananatis]
MDLFFHSLPSERKLRLHFHRFMLRVHEELNQLQGQENPLEKVADGFKAQTDILCFDEFFRFGYYRRHVAGGAVASIVLAGDCAGSDV